MPKKTKSNTKIPAKDECQTPAYGISPILPYLPKSWTLWECAVGEGLMKSALEDAGYFVVGTGFDFFESPYRGDFIWNCIVTNPPFSLKYKWLERCYELGKPFALLMPVDVIAAKSAQTLFAKYGVEILLLDKRIDFKMPNKKWDGKGADFSVAWFTWGLKIGRTLTYLCHIEKKGH